MKQSVKRFLHNNAVTLSAILLLLVILGGFLIARHESLYSIRNIANINPLITSGSAELVAVNVNGVVKIIKNEDGPSVDSDGTSPDEPKNSTPNKTVNGSSNGGSGSSSGNSPGSSVRPAPSSSPSVLPSPSFSPSPSQTSSPSPFTATVASLGPAAQRVYDVDRGRFGLFVVDCKNDHRIPAKVQITGGSGSAKVQWRLNGTLVDDSTLGFVSSGNVKTVEAVITTSGGAARTYSLTIDVINGDNSSKMTSRSMNIGHSC